MSVGINDIVKVNITNATPRFNVANFSTSLILGYVPYFSDRVKVYNDPADMLTDGFSTTDELYLQAVKHMSQAVQPSEFKVGRLIPDSNCKVRINFSAPLVTDGTFTITVGTETTAAIAYNASLSAIEDAIEALTGVEAGVVVTGTPVLGYTVEFAGTNAGTDFTVSANGAGLTPVNTLTVTKLTIGSEEEDAVVGYNAICEYDNSFIGVINTLTDADDILALAAVIETQDKLQAVVTTDSSILSTPYSDVATDLASKLKQNMYTKTMLIYTHDAANKVAAAIFGLQLSKRPGSSTFKFKTLTGITPTNINSTQRANLRSKNINIYEDTNGLNIFKEGYVSAGEFCDVVLGIMYMKARIATTIFGGLAATEKLPGDDDGIAVVVNYVTTSLIVDGAGNDIISRDSIRVTAPRNSARSAEDKAARILRDVKFTARLRGAIHFVYVEGTVSV